MLRPSLRSRVPLLALLAGLAACGDVTSGGLGPLDQLAGSWTATSWTLAASEGSREVDIKNQTGVVLDLVIRSDGRISGTLVAPRTVGGAFQTQAFSGSVSVEGDRMELSFDPDLGLFGQPLADWDVFYTLSGSSLTLEDPSASWDFDLSGPDPPVPARATVELRRVG